MPACFADFVAVEVAFGGVEPFALLRGNGADLVIACAMRELGIVDRVDMETGGGWFAGEFADALNEALLKVVG